MTTNTKQTQNQGQSCPNCEALTKQVTALKTCLEVERGFREQRHPAQPSQSRSDVKPWVGLTEDEKTEIRREHYARTLPLMDTVEAKLREKNA